MKLRGVRYNECDLAFLKIEILTLKEIVMHLVPERISEVIVHRVCLKGLADRFKAATLRKSHWSDSDVR